MVGRLVLKLKSLNLLHVNVNFDKSVMSSLRSAVFRSLVSKFIILIT